MKITTYIPSDYDLAPLIDEGITDYYFGYTPPFWKKTYSLTNSINRRYQLEGQVDSLHALDKLIFKKWGKPVRFFLALNNHLYTDGQIDKILAYFKDLFEKITGVICADLGLMLALKESYPLLKVHASLGVPCLNSEAVSFFKKIGVDRIILDRSITVDEVRLFKKKNSSIELEAFAFQQGCPHVEGLCTHLHDTECTCLANVHNFTPDQIKIENDYSDCFLRLHQLFDSQVEYVKIPRLADRGANAAEMINNYKYIFLFIKMLNLLHQHQQLFKY